jgi:hypothetical protein
VSVFKIITRIAFAAVFLVVFGSAGAATSESRIRLSNGITDVQSHGMKVRIVKATVPTSNAHTFDSYTSFILPREPNGEWLHILVDRPDGDSTDFRSVESADSNVQSIALYRGVDALFVVEARKTGLTPPALYLKKAKVVFTVYRFNGDLDYPRFVTERKGSSINEYLDAVDALDREFFH